MANDDAPVNARYRQGEFKRAGAVGARAMTSLPVWTPVRTLLSGRSIVATLTGIVLSRPFSRCALASCWLRGGRSRLSWSGCRWGGSRRCRALAGERLRHGRGCCFGRAWLCGRLFGRSRCCRLDLRFGCWSLCWNWGGRWCRGRNRCGFRLGSWFRRCARSGSLYRSGSRCRRRSWSFCRSLGRYVRCRRDGGRNDRGFHSWRFGCFSRWRLRRRGLVALRQQDRRRGAVRPCGGGCADRQGGKQEGDAFTFHNHVQTFAYSHP